MKKNTVLFGISIINVVLFLISCIVMIVWAARDTIGENYGMTVSIISGIFFEIITIVEIVKQKKNEKEAQTFFPFCIACVKKEKGKSMFQLVLAAILNVLPLALFIVILVALYLLSASDSKTAKNISKGVDFLTDNNQISGTSKTGKSSGKSNQELNKIAAKSTNNIKTTTPGEDKKIKKIYQDNPGISDEDALALFKKSDPNATLETVRAHKPGNAHTNDELNTIARHSGNDIKVTTLGDDKRIKKIYQENPGISDEDALALFKKSDPNATLETVRAHRPETNYTNDELNAIARRGGNHMKTTTPSDDKKIKKIYQDNPGISDEDAFAIFKKSDPNATLETVRAHKPR